MISLRVLKLVAAVAVIVALAYLGTWAQRAFIRLELERFEAERRAP